jgi:hypothetical protein
MYINLSIFALEAKAVQLENSCPLKAHVVPLVHMASFREPTLVTGGQSDFPYLDAYGVAKPPLRNSFS